MGRDYKWTFVSGMGSLSGMSTLSALLLALLPQQDSARRGIWIDRSEIMALPTAGPAWDAVVAASSELRELDLSNQDDKADTDLLAAAYVAVRTGDAALLERVHATIDAAMGSEDGGRTLALGRNLQALVVAADVVEHRSPAFCQWLRDVLREDLSGKTIISTHEERPNNWGTHAGASRIIADWFIFKWGTPAQRREAHQDGIRAVAVWKGWLGDRASHDGFEFGELDWQSDPAHPVGINPKGATLHEHSVDGVLPDDQRRAGGFAWPPPHENYVYEALQGATVAMAVMTRCRFPGPAALNWSDRALERAWDWLHDQCHFDASGDDEWQPWVVNRLYGRSFPTTTPASSGKGMGWTDWTHAP